MMQIRCKRCFKKYDDSFPLCPRCGKESEYKKYNGHDNYTREIDSENNNKKSRNKANIDRSKSKENLYDIHIEDPDFDRLDVFYIRLIDLLKILFKPLAKWFIAYRYCEFCGSKGVINDFYCKRCKNGFSGKYDEQKGEEDYPDPKNLRETVIDFVNKSNGPVNFNSFNDKLANAGFNLDNWNLDGEFKTGSSTSKYMAMAIYSSVIIFIMIATADGISHTNSSVQGTFAMWSAFLLIAGNLSMIPISKRYHSSYIVIYKKYISVNVHENRYQNEIYGANPDDIKSMELIFNSDMIFENVIFRANKNADVSNLVFSLSVLKYTNKTYLLEYLMLFAYKHKMNLYITKERAQEESDLKDFIVANKDEDKNVDYDNDSSIEHMNERKESLYVRIDSKVDGKTLTELEFKSHLSYLESISKSGFFMGGGFEKQSGGMIIYSATDIIDANEIAKEDPIIMSGAYTYELKEWNIVIKSDNEVI